jgi:hypothetical protein
MPPSSEPVWFLPSGLSDHPQQQKDQDNEQNEAESTSAVVADSRSHAVAAKAEEQDQHDEQNNHDASRITEGVRCRILLRGMDKDRSVKDRSSLAVRSGGAGRPDSADQEMITKNDHMTLPFRKK